MAAGHDVNYDQLLANCLGQKEYEKAQGIIIVVSMNGPAGTAVDVTQISETFKKLGFAIFRRENPTSNDLKNLIKAAAAYRYSTLKRFRFFAFYFAGHGGADGKKFSDLFINTAPTSTDSNPILHIEDIIDPLKRLAAPKNRLFMFDCCQSPGTGQADISQQEDSSHSQQDPYADTQEVVAFAVSRGQKATGDKDQGGLWTRHLCIKIQEKEPLVDVLIETNRAVRSESYQNPTFICSMDKTVVVATESRKEFSPDEVLEYLSGKSVQWSEIGQKFGVSFNDRSVLRRNGNLEDRDRLEAVINKWFEKKQADLNWDVFIRVLQNDLKYNDVAHKVKSDLKM